MNENDAFAMWGIETVDQSGLTGTIVIEKWFINRVENSDLWLESTCYWSFLVFWYICGLLL